MKSIKQKISRPYIALNIAIQLLVLVLFNVTVNIYSFGQAETELMKAANRLETNIGLASKPGPDKHFNPNIDNLKFLDVGSNTHIVVTENDSHRNITRFGERSLSDEIMTEAISKTKDIPFEDIATFWIDGEYYHAIKVETELLQPGQTVIYISEGHFASGLVDMVNVILVSVILVSIILFVVISQKIANSISKPIKEMSETIKNLKSNELIKIDNEYDSVELFEMSQEINEMNKRIYHYDKQQKSFLQNASHELRTPLMSIGGFAEGLQEGVFSQQQAIEVISGETKRLTTIVDNLLTLARIENYDTLQKSESVILNDFLSVQVNLLSGIEHNQGKKIVCGIPDEMIEIYTSEEILRPIVTNLISNALRHASTTVCVNLKKEQDIITISVADDGDGLSEHDIEHLFDRFYKGKGGNLGLGLSIAKTGADIIGAKIIAQNLEAGAMFKVVIDKSEACYKKI